MKIEERTSSVQIFSINVDIISPFIASCLSFSQRIKTDTDEGSKPRGRFSVMHTAHQLRSSFLLYHVRKYVLWSILDISYFDRYSTFADDVCLPKRLKSGPSWLLLQSVASVSSYGQVVDLVTAFTTHDYQAPFLALGCFFPQIYRSLFSLILGIRPLAILLALHRPSRIRLLLLACVWYYLSARGNQCQAPSNVGN